MRRIAHQNAEFARRTGHGDAGHQNAEATEGGWDSGHRDAEDKNTMVTRRTGYGDAGHQNAEATSGRGMGTLRIRIPWLQGGPGTGMPGIRMPRLHRGEVRGR